MNAAIYINFGTSLITFVFGFLLLTGLVFPGGNENTKLMLGIVLMIYGVYRFVNSYTKYKQNILKKNIEELENQREKFLKSK
ncbi:MAG: hypothetical protein JSS91_14180 [Bacteroidetes bacterium]|nr:hypothetical protein [Bacteroidota bacterium]